MYPLTTFIRFEVSFFSMSHNAYFIQYDFDMILFTYNSKIVRYFINIKVKNCISDGIGERL